MDSGKYLRRRLRASTKHALLLLTIAAGSAAAQPTQTGDAGRGVAALEAFLDGVKTLSGDFKQELYAADEHLLQTETGTFSLARPNRFRWVYAKPSELVVVADGAKLWMYDVELAQVTVAPLDDSVGSTPAMLLSGDRKVRDGFDVVQTYALDGLDWVKLAPKAQAADFTSVTIGFDGKAPQRLELVDGLNQITRIFFANVVVNSAVDAGAFEFHPPKGVDVIGGEG